MAPHTTIASLSRDIVSEADAYAYIESLLWGDTPTCSHCDGTDVYLINCENGHSRKTRTGAMSERRVWKCRECKRQFSVLTNTVMHGTKLSIRSWVMVIFEMCASKNGVAAREIERKYGLCPRTAWFMMHRIREGMANDGVITSMCGTIVADETYIGGKARNRHHSKRAVQTTPEPVQPGTVAGVRSANAPHSDKTIVLSLINEQTGEVRSQVVPDVTGQTLRKVIAEQVDMARSRLWTDEGSWYKQLGTEFTDHQSVNHSADEYVRYTAADVITTNMAEGYFSQLKRSLDGTHHHVSRSHLHRYLGEFDFRYSTCKNSDSARMRMLVGKMSNKRLTYRRTVTAA
jgi:transposase-like protein